MSEQTVATLSNALGKTPTAIWEALRTQTSFPMSALPNQLYNFDGK
jgi:hypothetical protein